MPQESTRILAQRKVYRDLGECRKALSNWYVDSSLEPTATEEFLRTAVEALMRAVSTLTEQVEQIGAKPTFEPYDVVVGDEAAAEIARQGIDPRYEAFRADQ